MSSASDREVVAAEKLHNNLVIAQGVYMSIREAGDSRGRPVGPMHPPHAASMGAHVAPLWLSFGRCLLPVELRFNIFLVYFMQFQKILEAETRKHATSLSSTLLIG